MNGWIIALCAWGALALPLAVVVGRAIHLADRRNRQPRLDGWPSSDPREEPDHPAPRDDLDAP